MKKVLIAAALLLAFGTVTIAQEKNEEHKGKHSLHVPAAVTAALAKKYPNASHVTWEKEKTNYEANWGGRSGEDNSVKFTPSGDFIEIVNAIPVGQLPAAATAYIKAHYKGAKITEAGKVTDAKGKITYEAEVNRKDIIFDENGAFIKSEK